MKYTIKFLKHFAIVSVMMLSFGLSQEDNTGEGVPAQEIQRNGLSGWQFLKINVDAKTGFMIGRIFKTKYAGNGVKLFNESGRYRLRISSSFTNWNFKVSQISPSEAELYSPKIR